MVLEYEGQCSSYEVGEYTRNKCLIWEEQNFKCCGQFQLAPDPALGKFDHGLGEHPWKNWGDGYPVPGHQDLKYEFCYGFEGDNLEGKARDWFRFDSGQRHLPRPHDSVAPREEVEAKCEKMCIEKHGMWMFRPKFGVEQFNRGDGFHHFDDICTHRMDCKKGPGHVDPKHPEVTQAPDTYTLEASTVFTDAHTYSPYWKRIQTI
ncbi:MAG: hypothetical protein L6R42_011351 [Xanthoria sp. 1 TBL-2021]|nr:MAG: hypothetical protein L6R42_011351 [Xanthoria sp. 1 TBL-2021]